MYRFFKKISKIRTGPQGAFGPPHAEGARGYRAGSGRHKRVHLVEGGELLRSVDDEREPDSGRTARHRGAALNSEIHRCLGITNFFGLRARAVANNENVRFT
jgi:hypothetical protein